MPLAFESTSHGTVAFGFFQIESDLLLLDRLVFFAGAFCRAVVGLAEGGPGARVEMEGWEVAGRRELGDLHGAIAGVDHGGLIGETYRLWPFPEDRRDFRQNPDGERTRGQVRPLLGRFGRELSIGLRFEPGTVRVQDYAFDRGEFGRLVAYVDRGGYPRWRDDRRPACVQAMSAALERLGSDWAPPGLPTAEPV